VVGFWLVSDCFLIAFWLVSGWFLVGVLWFAVGVRFVAGWFLACSRELRILSLAFSLQFLIKEIWKSAPRSPGSSRQPLPTNF
jgi:hypothetical protein